MAGPMRLAALAAGATIGFVGAKQAMRVTGAWSPEGRVAVVIGGTRGLGLLIARELLDQGSLVAICGRDEETLERAADQLGRGDDLLAEACDAGTPDEVRPFLGRVREELGEIDLLVIVAATIDVGGVETMDVSHFAGAMHDTWEATLHPVLEVLPAMRERREGRICVVGSIGGRIAFPHLAPYTAAKYAQVGLAEGLRAELASDGITVTTIIPGFMRTGSFLASDFHTPVADEYTWFATGATLPGITLSPEWAARRIVRAIRHGEADVTLGWFARLGGTVKSLMPGLSAEVFSLVDRWVLPHADGRDVAHARGNEVHESASEITKQLAKPVVDEATRSLNQPRPT